MERKQLPDILKDLEKKMVFLTGPRQVGKTWLALEIGKQFKKTVYLNYDNYNDKTIIQQEAWLSSTELLILDELHKMPGWKNYIKGVYDTKPAHLKILVTGSARLAAFQQMGDSLAGRFFTHRLLPFSMAELRDHESGNDMERFLQRGGFPEPFLVEEEREARRWRNQYTQGLIRTDVLDFERIHDLRAIQMIFELLRRRVGSPVSYASIARNVHLSPTTVMKYISILEALYIIFRVTPHSHNIARSILKEPKVYFFDTGLVLGDMGARFENFVALSLLKHIYGRNDYEGESGALHYLRTKDGKEVDFCLVQEDRIVQIIEVKYRDGNLSRNLHYFCHKYQLPGMQLVGELKRERTIDNIDILKSEQYLQGLFL